MTVVRLASRAILDRSMSRENVKLVGRVWPGRADMVEFVRAGSNFPPDVLALFEPNAEIEFVTGAPGVPNLRFEGLEGFAQGWTDWLIPFDRYELDPQEIIDAGDEVLVMTHVRARTRRGGVVVEHEPAAAGHRRGGRDGRVPAVPRPARGAARRG